MDSTRKTARLAGLLYLLASIPGAFALLYVPGKLVVSGDATATADRIRTSDTLFRMGIAAELLGFTLFIFVALVLYRLFKPVSERHALAMMVLFLLSVPISFLDVVNEIAALNLAAGEAAPGSCRRSRRISAMPWRICSSACTARDSSSRRSSGGSGCFRLRSASFDRVSSRAPWASC